MERKVLNEAIGKRVREIREYQELSREKVAERANISTQFLSDIEIGRKSMTTSTLYNISITLGVSADFLLFGVKENSEINPLLQMIEAMSPKEKTVAEDMLRVLIRSFSLNK